jgi:hypothetical protein
MKFMKPALAFLFILVVLTSCDNYGKKVTEGSIETYYKDGVSKEEATRTAAFMSKLSQGGAERKSFQLVRRNDSLCLRMVVDETKMKSIDDKNFLAITMLVSDSVFNGAPVNMDLTNDKFKTIRSLPYQKLTEADFQ